MEKALLTRLVFIARMKVVIAQVKLLGRRDRYRLYMSMMGSDACEIDGTDWAYILHRMVAGRHNVATYEKQVVTLENELHRSFGMNKKEQEEAWREVYETDTHLLDPILDLVHHKIDDFYTYAGKPY